MRKIFLIPLMTLVCSVMAWAADQHVSNIADLKAAIADANVETIYLDADIQYAESANSSCINILRSVTIDGQGHTLAGYGKRGTTSNYPTVAINQGGSSLVDVTLKNLQMINPMLRVVETRGNIHSVTIENCHIEALRANNSGYDQPITIGGNQSTQAAITIRNSTIKAPVYYPIVIFNPVNLTLENTDIDGWCSVYFKGQDSSAGSRGSVMVADNCHFNAPNIYSGVSNAFAMFPLEDDGISITLNNCAMDAEHFGDQPQNILSLSNNAAKARRTQAVSLTITGDNTYINSTLLNNTWAWGMVSKTDFSAPIPDPFPLSITISGGTYMFNPAEAWWYKNAQLEEPDKSAEANKGRISIPEGYEVKEIETQQGETSTTLYRVRQEITGSTALNDNAGQNATEDIKVTESVVLENENTIAEYVEVAGGESTDPKVTVTVGEGQTLEISNGMDITGNAEVVISAGATVEIGEGGVISENAENIVIEAAEDKSTAFLLSPDVVVNTTPLATYKFTSKARFHNGVYTYQRFGVPTFDGLTTMTWEGDVLTSLDRYNSAIHNWEPISTVAPGRYEIAGLPFQCYNMTVNKDQEVTYTFTGKLMGNQDIDLDFVAGWNCYANCYTAPINTASLLQQIAEKFGEGVNGAIYIYKRGEENATAWEAITLGDFEFFGEAYLASHGVKEMAPMQAFILNLRDGDSAEGTISYVDNIYNPYKANQASKSSAPKAEYSSNTGVVFYISDGTNSDKLTLFEKDDLSDAFDPNYDADKYDNGFDFSVYCMLGDSKLSAFGSNSLKDKNIAFDTKVAGEFTLSVEIAVGETVQLLDNVENKILDLTTGASYTFKADAINDPARFTINPSGAPSAIDNTDVVGTTSKFMKDGQLYIRRAGNVYTVQGQNVK